MPEALVSHGECAWSHQFRCLALVRGDTAYARWLWAEMARGDVTQVERPSAAAVHLAGQLGLMVPPEWR
jgi:hypothetical protein